MNFGKYFAKKIFLSLLGIWISISISFFILSIFIYNQEDAHKMLISKYFAFLFNIFNHFGKVTNSQFISSFNNSLDLFSYYYKYSFVFVFIGFLFSIIFGFLIGIFLGYKNGKFSDLAISGLIFSLSAIPIFILAPVLIIIGQLNDIPILFVESEILGFWFMLYSLILPLLLLIIAGSSYFAIIVKSNILSVLSQEYINVLKTLGLSRTKIFFKAVFKNLILSVINQFSSLLLILISFSLLLERIFQIPGQSLLLFNAFNANEINVIMTIIFFKAVLIISLDFICQLIYDIFKSDNGLNFDYGFKKLKTFMMQKRMLENEK